MRVITWIFRIAILILLIFLAVQNNAATRFTLFNDVSIELPLIVILFIFFGLGALMGALIFLPKYWRQGWVMRKLRKENDLQKEQLAKAGVTPTVDPTFDIPMTM